MLFWICIIIRNIIFCSVWKTGVKNLSVTELNDLLEEIETAIKDYSEELVQQLALRDELEFEKEVKNSFISVLIEVQNKQREQKEMAKKKKKLKNGSPQNGKQERSHMPGTVRILSFVSVDINQIRILTLVDHFLSTSYFLKYIQLLSFWLPLLGNLIASDWQL